MHFMACARRHSIRALIVCVWLPYVLILVGDRAFVKRIQTAPRAVSFVKFLAYSFVIACIALALASWYEQWTRVAIACTVYCLEGVAFLYVFSISKELQMLMAGRSY